VLDVMDLVHIFCVIHIYKYTTLYVHFTQEKLIIYLFFFMSNMVFRASFKSLLSSEPIIHQWLLLLPFGPAIPPFCLSRPGDHHATRIVAIKVLKCRLRIVTLRFSATRGGVSDIRSGSAHHLVWICPYPIDQSSFDILEFFYLLQDGLSLHFFCFGILAWWSQMSLQARQGVSQTWPHN